MPKRSDWRVAQFGTLRLRRIKIAARVVEVRTQIRVHLPTASPAQAILRLVLGRIPRLATRPAEFAMPRHQTRFATHSQSRTNSIQSTPAAA